jgi:hypothetical protein
MTANTPASRKAKGASLQRWIRDKLLEAFTHLQPDDVRSTSMGASGEDVLLSPRARESFPYSIECKNVEKINIWAAYDQAVANSKEFEPLVVIKKAKKKPLVVVDAEYFINLLIDK